MFPDLSRVTTHPCPLTSCQQYKYMCILYICVPCYFVFCSFYFHTNPILKLKFKNDKSNNLLHQSHCRYKETSVRWNSRRFITTIQSFEHYFPFVLSSCIILNDFIKRQQLVPSIYRQGRRPLEACIFVPNRISVFALFVKIAECIIYPGIDLPIFLL